MKKTLILAAFSLGLSVVASAATVFTSTDEYDLSSPTSITDSALSGLIKPGTDPGTGTIMMWVNLSQLPADGAALFGVACGTSANGLNGWGVRVNADGSLQMGRESVGGANLNQVGQVGNGAAWSELSSSSASITAGEWFHVTVSSTGGRGSSNFTLYINGVQVATSNGFGLNGNSFNNLFLGSSLNGSVSGLTVDGTVLDANAIQQIMANTNPTPEPATASLSLLGLAALMMRRRRA